MNSPFADLSALAEKRKAMLFSQSQAKMQIALSILLKYFEHQEVVKEAIKDDMSRDVLVGSAYYIADSLLARMPELP